MICQLPRYLLALMLTLAVGACGKDDERKSAEARPRTHAYVYNDRVSFAYGGQGERFQIQGWSGMEQGFTWTDGEVASLGFRLQQSRTPVLLHVKMAGNTRAPELPFQPVDVVIVETFARPPHQKTIAHWDVAEEKVFTTTIPKEFVRGPETITRLEFHIPKAVSPADLGGSGDRRRLGLRVAELTFEQTKQQPGNDKGSAGKRRPFDYEYGEAVAFSAGGDAERLQVKGWSGPEADYTWTTGPSAMLGLRLRPSKIPVTLSLRAAGMNSPPAVPFQPVDVIVNGEQLAHWEVADETTLSAVIPERFTVAPENIVFVEFQLPRAISPAALGNGADGRQLGLRVRELSIEPTTKSVLQP